MTAITQTAFARLMGWSKGYVTQLKQAGRLVMTDAGLVDVDASRARIDATRDPNRDDTVSRHAASRSVQTDQDASAKQVKPHAEVDTIEDAEVYDFQTARAIKESYLARNAKVDYEERTGKLVDAEAVSLKQYELARQIRDSMQSIPARIAEQLAAEPDAAVCARMLETEIRQALESAADLAGQIDDDIAVNKATPPTSTTEEEAA